MVVGVHVAQVGSIEAATGGIGRILLHTVVAADRCADGGVDDVQPSRIVISAVNAYQDAFARFAASGVPGNKQPIALASRLSRNLENPLESLGGRLPPERALQLVALTIPLRSAGALGTLVFEPSPVVAEVCP